MHIQKSFQSFIRRAFPRVVQLPASTLSRRWRRGLLLGAAAAALLLTSPARADMISTITEGPADAPYAYNLTIEFQNGNYYDFILRSVQPTITGYNLIQTVASLTPGMTTDQTYYASFNAYVLNGVTIGNDTNSGFTNNNYWAYWDGTATNPVQWTPDQTGESGRTLTPGQADGWVYSDGTNPPQATTFAVPEPGTWAWLGLSLVAGWAVRQRSRRPRAVASLSIPV